LATEKGEVRWRQQWVDYDDISDHLKRAVIASEDDGFLFHDGVEWDAVEKAWERNAKTQSVIDAREQARKKPSGRTPKIIGGSTITQQLAKNLFLSGERTFLRKGQEFLLTGMLEIMLSKERILEIYLNNVEWGEGIFGAEAAAQAYFKKPAAKLAPIEAARLAVMLPRPKYFEKLPNSSYLAARSASIAARMSSAELP
jgi:monofunctional glycosyltransferase